MAGDKKEKGGAKRRQAGGPPREGRGKATARRKGGASSWLLPLGVLALLVLAGLLWQASRRPQERVPSHLTGHLEGETLGRPDAPVTVVEYADYQCPVCARWETLVFPTVRKELVDTGLVRFVFKPFSFIGRESVWAAEAALCASDQGKFFEASRVIFSNWNGENRGNFTKPRLLSMLGQAGIGLDGARLKECLESGRYSAVVERLRADAEAAGVRATPTFVVDGEKIEGYLSAEEFRAKVELALERKGMGRSPGP